jgi:hypothetical protein
MELDCPHLSLARHWAGEDLDKHIALVDSLDALRLCGAGAFETVSSADALWNFERESRRLGQEIVDFAVRVGLASPWWSGCDDDDLTDLVAQGIARGDLVGLRKGKAVAATKPTVEQRRLVAQIDAVTRGRLHQGGRHYRLVAGDDLDDTPDRDSYVVVPRDEAGQILDRMVKEAGAAANLATLLGQARDKLTPDWRPPLAPDGLILLRRSSAARMHSSDLGPALTPSQIKKLAAKDWIEIEVVDQDGEPYSPHYRLDLGEQLVNETNFPDDGVLGLYEIESGTYKLTLGEVKLAPAVAEEVQKEAPEETPQEEPASAEEATPLEGAELMEEEEPAEEPAPEVAPIKLRFKLLDLVGNPISDAQVTVAGAAVTTDGDGMVETDIAAGASNLTATLPSGDIGLSAGSLDPTADAGWKTRLFNMGFLWDPSVDDSDDEMIVALEDFQAQYEIPVSGRPDDATKAKIVEVYGC